MGSSFVGRDGAWLVARRRSSHYAKSHSRGDLCECSCHADATPGPPKPPPLPPSAPSHRGSQPSPVGQLSVGDLGQITAALQDRAIVIVISRSHGGAGRRVLSTPLLDRLTHQGEISKTGQRELALQNTALNRCATPACPGGQQALSHARGRPGRSSRALRDAARVPPIRPPGQALSQGR